MSTSFDWSTFSVRIPIHAPVDELYRAWTTRKGIEHWFLRKSEFVRPDGTILAEEEPVQTGDRYTWLWHGYGDNDI